MILWNAGQCLYKKKTSKQDMFYMKCLLVFCWTHTMAERIANEKTLIVLQKSALFGTELFQ